MTQYRIAEAATLLGVSDDTVRRWVSGGALSDVRGDGGRHLIDGAELAAHAQRIAAAPADPSTGASSARNRLVGLVTGITTDGVMAQVEMQCGPHRIVSLLSSEAVRDLGLEVGSRGVAVVKATMVVIETTGEGR